jgi:hypothetical protein
MCQVCICPVSMIMITAFWEKFSCSQFSPIHRKLTIFKVIEIFGILRHSENPRGVERETNSFESLERFQQVVLSIISEVPAVCSINFWSDGRTNANTRNTPVNTSLATVARNHSVTGGCLHCRRREPFTAIAKKASYLASNPWSYGVLQAL